ncbi:hypothetical protein Stsp01_22980 [Streptomyces sp. NBRC 13847]|nr:hypothetical protein Stsp01_22980 [Streptomyces sp. NBRC 13847]
MQRADLGVRVGAAGVEGEEFGLMGHDGTSLSSTVRWVRVPGGAAVRLGGATATTGRAAAVSLTTR